MRIIKDFPPNYAKLKKHFDVSSAVFTYGDTIYSPRTEIIPDHLMAHEQVHSLQQVPDPKKWWDRYSIDRKFRLNQEVQAYRRQFLFVKRNSPRQVWRKFLRNIARDLSGKMYKLGISYNEAKEKIKNEK